MTLPTHIILGAIIGKVTGNYSLAVVASIAPDLDHFSSYIKNGVIKNPRKLWHTITNEGDPYGDQRGIFHNIVFFILASIILILVFKNLGWIMVAGWFGHIILDALDASDYWPLYPNKSFNLKGFVKYFSKQEILLFLILFVIYIIL